MSRIMWLLGIAVVMAAGTALGGWWAVPLLGALAGLRRRPLEVGLAAVLAWGGLLLWQASRGPVGVLAERVGGILSMPGPGLFVITAVFAGLVAWSAAVLAHAIGRSRLRPTS